MNELKFNYIANIKSYILPILFSLGGCFLFALKALNNVDKFTINKIVTLSKNNSTILLWILFRFSLIFFILFIYALFKTIKNKNDGTGIIITDSNISVPTNGFSKKNVLIQFDSITEIYTENFNNSPCLIIRSRIKK